MRLLVPQYKIKNQMSFDQNPNKIIEGLLHYNILMLDYRKLRCSSKETRRSFLLLVFLGFRLIYLVAGLPATYWEQLIWFRAAIHTMVNKNTWDT